MLYRYSLNQREKLKILSLYYKINLNINSMKLEKSF